jgi:hypothetical protein
MPATEKHSRHSGCRRIAVWVIVLLTISVAVVVVFLASGVPQRSALQTILSSQLKARVDVGEVSLRNPVSIQSLVLTDAASTVYAPFLSVENLAADYRWASDALRHIEEVRLSGVQLSAQGGPDDKNYQFLLDILSAPASEFDPTPWIPERLLVDEVWAELRHPGYYLRMDNLAASVALYSLAAGTLQVHADNLGIAWESDLAPGGHRSQGGALQLQLAWDDAGVAADIHADLGKLALLEGTASLSERGGAPYLEVNMPAARLDDPLWPAMLAAHTPIPIRFEGVTLSDVRLGLHMLESGLSVDAAELESHVSAFQIGPDEAPFYEGPLAAKVHGSYGATTAVVASVELGDGHAMSAEATFEDGGFAADFAVSPWPREMVAALLPVEHAPLLDSFPTLNTLGISGTVQQGVDGLALDSELALGLGERDTLTVPLHATMMPSAEGQKIHVETDLALGEETLALRLSGVSGGGMEIDSEVRRLHVNRWTEAFLGEAALAGLGGAFSGEVSVGVVPEEPLSVGFDLSGENLRYGELQLPEEVPTSIGGTLDYNLDDRKIRGRNLHVAQEGTADVKASDWRLNLVSGDLSAALDTQLSLAAVMTLFEMDGLYGDAELRGDLTVNERGTRLDGFNARSEDLGYETYDISVPYGMALTLAGSLGYVNDENTLSFTPIEANLDEGTRLAIEELELKFPGESTPFRMEARPLSLETNLKFLVNMEYLSSVEGGRATLTSPSLRWEGDFFLGLTTWEIVATALEMPDEMIALENLKALGEYDPGKGQTGGGPLTADRFTVYGMPFGALDTRLTLDATHLKSEGLRTTFLSGNLQLDTSVAYRDPAWSTRIDMDASGIDLTEFTNVFEPPDVVLTGIVSGTVAGEFSLEGLTSLDVDLLATEGLSMNRSMVRQILMSQYVNDAVGSKSVQKVIEKVIGKAEQRPFDRAVLELGLEDGLIVGIARLESKSLDVTVDIRAEPKALLEAIRSSTANTP